VIALVLAVVLVVLAHEAAHGLLLARAGAHPRPAARAWGLKGVGWSFHPQGIPLGKLRLQWLAGPTVEVAGWLVCAALIPWARPMFLLLVAVSLVGNSLPGGDLNKAVLWRPR